MSHPKVWNSDFVGILATEDDMKNNEINQKPVFVNSHNYVQFYIKNLTEPPEEFPHQTLFTCFSYELSKYGYEDPTDHQSGGRERVLKEFLVDSLILFRPMSKEHQVHGEVFHAKEIRIIPKLDRLDENHILKAIPVFSREVHHLEFNEFEYRLLQGKSIGKIENISREADDTPTIVLWRHDPLHYEMFGLFKSHHYSNEGFILTPENGLRSVKVSEEWLQQTYQEGEPSDTLLFVDTSIYSELEKQLEKMPLYNSKRASNKEKVEVFNHVVETQDSDRVFMEQFIQVTREMGLIYNERDLYNFHTAMKSNVLTILAGMSGTGKSKLVQAYGKTLGLDATQLVFIPVRPSWTDDADVVGYVDTTNMVYRPADSGFIDTLCQAQAEENRNQLYVICFDEMNLARVEHYFSQFLSVLEMEPDHRVLRLYSDRISSQIYNSVYYPSEIKIGPNVIFVGTVNLDESTYHFSDKVLDRANVITLDIQPYHRLGEVLLHKDGDSLSESEIELLWNIHVMMQAENKNLGIGPRVIIQMNQYIRNLPPSPHLTRKEAFDLQLVQRVLTKLRGSEGLLKNLVGKLDQNGDRTNGKLYEIIEVNSALSDFEHAKKAIIQKAKELKVNGFTI